MIFNKAAILASTLSIVSAEVDKCTRVNPNQGFIAAGKQAEVNFGDLAFNLNFHDDKTMTFTSLADPNVNDTVQYTAVEVRPLVYMVYWTETEGDRVVHVEDFGCGLAWTNIADNNGTFVNLAGTIKLIC